MPRQPELLERQKSLQIERLDEAYLYCTTVTLNALLDWQYRIALESKLEVHVLQTRRE